ncbi:hypothetical protein PFLUV_G00048880 [Perca fluviatilis]|uniref:Uncharacterized protein n=1 Tax=Perca fluviatilis TaxID=8168 RepID=A0A6A5FGN7_PERFL|nr:parathyroid hormone 4 isoform X1 [Perca fluviatilis]KAF1392088.1 hypothetical protein PFLUV_G00048880 [Perca fluviatilis]
MKVRLSNVAKDFRLFGQQNSTFQLAVLLKQSLNRRRSLDPPPSPSQSPTERLGACRRAVTEHQLMHDRGQNIQSLKRLIWLSSAIEGLHTAQTRSAAFNPTKVLNLALNPKLVPAAGIPQPNRVESLMRDFFNPYLTQQPDREA